MMSKVLVPLDKSRLAEAVLPSAIRLVKAGSGSLILLHAVTPSDYFSVTAARYVHEERQHSAEYFEGLAERIDDGDFGIEERILTGEASREIVAEAKRDRVDLIVMASHGRSGVRDWAFGSVAERVLRSTNIPVLIFRGNVGRSTGIRKILIALDGSEEALEVLGPACDLAGAYGSSLVLVHVGRKFPAVMPLAEKFLTQRGRAFEKRLLRGDPATAILGAIDAEKADLLALTTTGEAKRDQIHFGSVAEKVLKACPRPMLVVHTGRTR
jgi:nucleotide-binding universal stress UspA family protein